MRGTGRGGMGRKGAVSAPQAKAWPPELFSWRRRWRHYKDLQTALLRRTQAAAAAAEPHLGPHVLRAPIATVALH